MRNEAHWQDWPKWATERVQVHLPDEAWQRRGEKQCRLLDADLAHWLIAPVERGVYRRAGPAAVLPTARTALEALDRVWDLLTDAYG